MDTMMMNHSVIESLIAVISGVLILVYPHLLNYVVAIYFIIKGALGLPYVHGSSSAMVGSLAPLVAGILILVYPRLLNTIVAIALIILGVTGLMH